MAGSIIGKPVSSKIGGRKDGGRACMQTIHELTKDIENICTQLNIKWKWFGIEECKVNCANAKKRLINVGKISNLGDYAAALHEIAHVECDPDEEPKPGMDKILNECKAWQWAIEKSEERGHTYDARAWRRIGHSLEEYLEHSNITKEQAPAEWKIIMQNVKKHPVYSAPSFKAFVPKK